MYPKKKKRKNQHKFFFLSIWWCDMIIMIMCNEFLVLLEFLVGMEMIFFYSYCISLFIHPSIHPFQVKYNHSCCCFLFFVHFVSVKQKILFLRIFCGVRMCCVLICAFFYFISTFCVVFFFFRSDNLSFIVTKYL